MLKKTKIHHPEALVTPCNTVTKKRITVTPAVVPVVAMSEEIVAGGPFIKWAGGKAKLVEQLSALLPPKIEHYYEPFVGGGALFWHLAPQRRFKAATLSDTNAELIQVYRAIRNHVFDLMKLLTVHELSYGLEPEAYYYRIRDRYNQNHHNTLHARAADFVFLNKTGFNGLFRVNKKGTFNVPWGKSKQKKLFNKDNLLACSKVLQFTNLVVADFLHIEDEIKKGDAVYCDPPYVPLSASSNFASYTKEKFGAAEHERLAQFFGRIASSGATVLLSNSDTEVVRKLYKGYRIKRVEMRRNINSKGHSRDAVSELIMIAP